MAPRVLVVHKRLDLGADVEQVVAGDGDAALDLAVREPFDAVVVDLRLDPLDGWYLLAAIGTWPDSYRPRIIATVADRAEILRAVALGADLCVTAGTLLHARALVRSTKETACPQHPAISSRPPTPNGVPA